MVTTGEKARECLMSEPSPRPTLRIVRGEPTAEELAVLTTLVTAASGADRDEPVVPQRGRWADPVRQHVHLPRPGVGAWASSLR